MTMDQPVIDRAFRPDPARPVFLRQSSAEVKTRYFDLQWQCRLAATGATNRKSSEHQHNHHQTTDDKNGNGRPVSSIGPNSEDGRSYRIMDFPHLRPYNRYTDIAPFVDNRVPLAVASPDRNDYINASPIRLSKLAASADRNWIATQGPVEATVSDFWRMVYDAGRASGRQGPAVIAMLTPTHEPDGREKCFPYFPTHPRKDRHRDLFHMDNPYGDDWHATVTVRSQTEIGPARATVRELELASYHVPASLRRYMAPSVMARCLPARKVRVWHVLFTGWPDLAIPDRRHWDALVRYIGLVRHLGSGKPLADFALVDVGSAGQEALSGSDVMTYFPAPPPSTAIPTIVHCSAGVGRTGTFIALDHLISDLVAGNMDSLVDRSVVTASPGEGPPPVRSTVSSLESVAKSPTTASPGSARSYKTADSSPPAPQSPDTEVAKDQRRPIQTRPVLPPLLPPVVPSAMLSMAPLAMAPTVVPPAAPPLLPPEISPLSPILVVPVPRLLSQASHSALFKTAKSKQVPMISIKTKLSTAIGSAGIAPSDTFSPVPPRPQTASCLHDINPFPTTGPIDSMAVPAVPTIPPIHRNVGRTFRPSLGGRSTDRRDENVFLELADEKDPVFVTVATLRKQRLMMVQQGLQYEFLYAVLNRMWDWRRGVDKVKPV